MNLCLLYENENLAALISRPVEKVGLRVSPLRRMVFSPSSRQDVRLRPLRGQD